MKTLLLICISLGFCNLSHAQTVVQKTNNGLVTQMQIGQKATSADVYAVFGKPDKQESHYDDAAGGTMTTYDYKGFSISAVDNVAYDFGVYTNEYVVKINNKYIAKVGMPIQTFRNSIPASEVRVEERGGNIIFRFKIPGMDIFAEDALFVMVNAQDVINNVFWHVPE